MGKALIIKGADFSAVSLSTNITPKWKAGFWIVKDSLYTKSFAEYTGGTGDGNANYPNYAGIVNPIPISSVSRVIVSSGYSIKFAAIDDSGECVARSTKPMYEGTYDVGNIMSKLASNVSMFALNVTTKECQEAGGGDEKLLVDMRTKLSTLNEVVKLEK